MRNYREFCKENGIPARSRKVLVAMALLGGNGESTEEFKEQARKVILSRIIQLEDFIARKTLSCDYESALNALSLYCLHAEQYLKLKDDETIRESVVGYRQVMGLITNVMENPNNHQLISEIPDVPVGSRKYKRFVKELAERTSRNANEFGITNWAFADERANKAFKGRGWSYP